MLEGLMSTQQVYREFRHNLVTMVQNIFKYDIVCQQIILNKALGIEHARIEFESNTHDNMYKRRDWST